MKLSKRQKVFVALAAVAVAVLAIDRLTAEDPASGPVPAKAAARRSPRRTPPPAAAQAPDNHTDAPAAVSIARRIEEQAARTPLEIASVPDAMRPAESWLRVLVPEPQPQTAAPKAAPVTRSSPAELFAGAHVLQAVMVSDNQRLAVVDGKCLSVGDRIGAFTLTGIENEAAVFECNDQRVTLPLKVGP